MFWIAIIIAFVALLISSIIDLKTREVPDYISYGLIIIAFALALFNTILFSDYSYLIQTVMGFAVGVAIAYAMFYLGQWGGGDSKLIMGLGAVIGFNVFHIFGKNNFWLLVLFVAIIFFGAIYGLIWTLILAIIRRKIFVKNLNIWMKKREVIIARRIILVIILIALLFIWVFASRNYLLVLTLFVLMFYVIFYLWLFVKVIEEACMIKDIPINKLTEGDWIYRNVYIGKKLITGPKDLGISREQIALLKKYSSRGKIKTVTIKEGIPFVPAFLVAYVATIIVYYFNLLWFLG